MAALETGRRGRTELRRRYTRSDLDVFTPDEAARFSLPAADEVDAPLPEALAWELLYRIEPELYDRWALAERLHPGILDWLPAGHGRVIEVGAGSGRLTLDLAQRSVELIAAEPAAGMRSILSRRLVAEADNRTRVVEAFADRLPVADDWADLVVACSVLTPDRAHGGDEGLQEMERVCAPGGMVVVVWPNHLDWLEDRGYRYVSFPGEMWLEFESPAEAVELVEIFYPAAVDEIQRRGSARVAYSAIGVNPPRDLAYKGVSA